MFHNMVLVYLRQHRPVPEINAHKGNLCFQIIGRNKWARRRAVHINQASIRNDHRPKF